MVPVCLVLLILQMLQTLQPTSIGEIVPGVYLLRVAGGC